MSALKALADHFREGDWPMWPILAILIVVWAIIIERIVYLKKAGIDKEKLLALLKSQIMAGNIQGAIKVCSGNPTPMTRIIQAGLTKFNRSDAEVQAAMDEAALRELPRLEKRTGYLAMLGALLFHDKGRRTLVLAVRSLWLHKLRSVLSVLGIVIANIAVMVLLAFGEGTKKQALDAIRRQGATNIIIRSVKPPDATPTGARTFIVDYGLKNRDFEQFLTIPGITKAVDSFLATRAADSKHHQADVAALKHELVERIAAATGGLQREAGQGRRRRRSRLS